MSFCPRSLVIGNTLAPEGHYYWMEVIRGIVNTKHVDNKPIICVWVDEMVNVNLK